ncbi:hypothetical protein NDU88_006877 [Pleurodeles waltl]|uniref:Uncharacterized protein n=1 Tax=Pleurodeles waltl TaxID=8319 RepID=A0AAV7RRD7_PLEWA|nr:hypothetical protein NDU88_006877 [Pleurodeles waltl]
MVATSFLPQVDWRSLAGGILPGPRSRLRSSALTHAASSAAGHAPQVFAMSTIAEARASNIVRSGHLSFSNMSFLRV